MSIISENQSDNEEFLFDEEIIRYKLSVDTKDGSAINTSNDLNALIDTYNELVQDSINKKDHVVVSIYDFDKGTNVYYYDSEQERC